MYNHGGQEAKTEILDQGAGDVFNFDQTYDSLRRTSSDTRNSRMRIR